MWKPGEALCKKQMAETAQNAAFQWLRVIRVRERQLMLGHKALHLRLYVWEGTVLWAWRRWNSSKQNSNQKNVMEAGWWGLQAQQEPPSQHHCNGHWWRVSMAAGTEVEPLPEKGQPPSQGDRRPSRTHSSVADGLYPLYVPKWETWDKWKWNHSWSRSITKPLPEPRHLRLSPSDGGTGLQCKNPRIRTPETSPGENWETDFNAALSDLLHKTKATVLSAFKVSNEARLNTSIDSRLVKWEPEISSVG